jgi:Fur family transcriptional regulator, ferric uptake regulator
MIIVTTKRGLKLLLARRLKMTTQRQVILEELAKVTSHPTAGELYDQVRKRLPHISLGTVYRNLEIMADSGMIQKLETAGTQKRFDAVVKNHYHVRCMGCDRVDDVEGDTLPDVEEAIRGFSDYTILGHRLEFVGMCPECRSGHHESDGDGPNIVKAVRLSD